MECIIYNITFQTVQNICSSGAGNAGCGVTTGSTGSKELHYVLRALAPAACQHSQLFVDACRNNMRIALPSITSRREFLIGFKLKLMIQRGHVRFCVVVESMETALVGPNGVQTIRPSNKTEPLQYSSNLSPVVVSTIRQLLDALVAVKDETKEGKCVFVCLMYLIIVLQTFLFAQLLLRHCYWCGRSGVRIQSHSNRTQCGQRITAAATFLRSCVARALSRGDGPRTRYTLRRHKASIMKIFFVVAL